MNILIDLLPEKIDIEGVEYAINSDFRTSMLFELMMADNELDDKQKIEKALLLYYPKIPLNINLAVEQILWFYRCGKDMVISGGIGKDKSMQIYDFNFDDDYIYSAFLDQYGVDLQDIKNLHWWKFKAMFKSLKEDNEIVKIMGYRSMDLSKIKDKEQKAHYKKMKDLYKINDISSKDEIEKLNSIESTLINGGDLSKLL
ncbi:bacteriophage Gp15 family protein [Clostridium estertheticum]|uniref:bacteriophage Gp15 family protein n=1 Tax=Clostridium estertheticum TaxID=238834 RepID=UPI001CF5DCA7|nr:bacteriophage Gp15 family protein [Clostridium estertheticum]MCB2308822.1 bacteriophage Gp15 family protein [Clostridium estertheticum]MCB2347310.1 bacteriophage Gp15 family protein [Clostridium estertheticum]MCB2351924.1 bacteriophage Gp15 family protein [Clostridium estertheticum]WAG48509.1 bacteriophage Gp15 family protein [Clostridium estertheticum]